MAERPIGVLEALAQASDAMDEAFAARIDDGEESSKPSAARKGEYIIVPSSDVSARAALYVAMKEGRFPSRSLPVHCGSTRKRSVACSIGITRRSFRAWRKRFAR